MNKLDIQQDNGSAPPSAAATTSAPAPAPEKIAKTPVARSRPAAAAKPKPAAKLKPAAKPKSAAKPAASKAAAVKKQPVRAKAKPAVAANASRAKKSPVPAIKTLAHPAAANAKPVAAAKEKVKKAKLVRDSFTMPEAEYEVLSQVKKACLKAGISVKKSELLRIGVALIKQLDAARLKAVLDTLLQLKTGRPKKIT